MQLISTCLAGRQFLWASHNPRKRWTELLLLLYSPFWITWALVILVPFRLYEVSFKDPAARCCTPGKARC